MLNVYACAYVFQYESYRRLLDMLCYTATKSCHNLWLYACARFADATRICVCMLRSVC